MPLSRPALLLGLALLAACSKPKTESPATLASSAAPQPSLAATPTLAASTAPGVARKVEESNSLYEFDYAYPAAAAAIPGLRKLLEGDMAKQRAELIAEAREGQADAKANGYDFRPHSRGGTWQVVAALPGWLSLSENIYSDSGGAHPNHGFAAMLWDKQADTPRKAEDLFASKQALSEAIRRPFCAALDKQRAEKRGEPVKPGSDDQFDACIDPVDSTIILGSSNRQAFDRIGVLVGPYEAGPYVEGDYEVTLPVTDAVLAAVKPEYRASFTAKH